MSSDPVFDAAGAAKWLRDNFGTRTSVGSLAKARHYGQGPEYFRFGPRGVRYRESDLRAWAEARLSDRSYSHTAEYVPQDRAA
jgi:hypothetical protein